MANETMTATLDCKPIGFIEQSETTVQHGGEKRYLLITFDETGPDENGMVTVQGMRVEVTGFGRHLVPGILHDISHMLSDAGADDPDDEGEPIGD